MPPRARPAWFRPAAVAAAALLTLGALEAGARVAAGPRFVQGGRRLRPQDALGRHDPDLGWAFLPDRRTALVADDVSYRVTTNALGFRGPEVPEARTPGAARIVLLGDSFAFGWGVDDDATFAARLAETGVGGRPVEVANLGVSGYATDQQLWTFERHGARLRPDVVLLQFCRNDPEANDTTSVRGWLKPRYAHPLRGDAAARAEWVIEGRPVPPFETSAPPDLSERIATHSALWAAATGRLALPGRLSREANRASVADAASRMGDASTTRMLLGRLAEACRAAGARLVVFDASHPDALDAPTGPADEDVFLTPLSRRLRELAPRCGFVAASVDRALHDAARDGEDVTIVDGHWSATGHRVVASALAARLAPLLPSR